MNSKTFLVVIGIFVSWGLGSFLAKLAATRIGTKSVFFDILGAATVLIPISLIVFKLKNLLHLDRTGIVLAFLAGAIGSIGGIGAYFLLSKLEASTVFPLLALYPALTVVLAIIFLHESLNLTKLLGILLSLVAIYLLSK